MMPRPQRRKPLPTPERVRQLLSYDPATGIFLRIIAPGRRTDLVGTRAGYIDPTGYRTMNLDGVLCRAARVAWAYMTNEWPADDVEIDHRNLVEDDDCWSNLRVATSSQQKCNTRRTRAASGVRGVRFRKGKWDARIKFEGREHRVGRFVTLPEAAAAWAEAAARIHGQFAYKETEDGRTRR